MATGADAHGRDATKLKADIKEHYDVCSPLYSQLWGSKHLHHGYWITGEESREVAADQLVEELIKRAKLPANPKVLDTGCGYGGTSIMLALKLGATCTGITLSTTQVAMATENAAKAGVAERTRFLEMDGERMKFPGEEGTFDAVWISEALSHFGDKHAFFANAFRMLKPGGKLVLADWFRADHIGSKFEKGVIKDIEVGMLLPRLDSMTDYLTFAKTHGLRLLWLQDISKETAKTWDISLELISNPAMWSFAVEKGTAFVEFLKAFKAMIDGFKSNCFRYGLMVWEKPTDEELADE